MGFGYLNGVGIGLGKVVRVVICGELSDRGSQAKSYLRGHKSILDVGADGMIASQAAALFRKNDTGRSFVSEREVATNAGVLTHSEVLGEVLHRREEIVEAGLAALVAAVGKGEGIDEDVRTSCRFDLLSILRVVSYAASVESVDFIHRENLQLYKVLYDELGLSLGPLVAGIAAMRDALRDSRAAPCFDQVIEALNSL